MRKRWLIALLTLLGVVCAVWLLSNFENRAPLHKGKTVSYWVDRACGRNGSSFRLDVKQIGAPAVPYLIAKLRAKDTSLRTTWMTLQKVMPFGLGGFRSQPATLVRADAAECLALIGPDAKAAVPDLIKLLNQDRYSSSRAVNALGMIGAAKEALPILEAKLGKETNLLHKIEDAWAIWKIGGNDHLLLEVCTKAISQQSEDSAAMNAALALGQMGRAALPAAPQLVELLKDMRHSNGTRGNAALALGTIGATNSALIAALKDGTKDPDLSFRSNCARSLWRLDSNCVSFAVPIIIEGIIDWNKRHPESKLEFMNLRKYDQVDLKTAIPALKGLVDSDSNQVKELAAEVLEKIDSQPADAGRTP